MKLKMRGIAALLLPLVLTGCEALEEPTRPAPGAPLAAAVVPGADLLVELDLQAVRQAPIFAVLGPMLKDAEEAEETGEAEDGEDADAGEKGEKGEKFDEKKLLEALGLQQGDFLSLVMSARLAGADSVPATEEGGEGFDPDRFRDVVKEAPAAFAVLLAKPVALDRLEQGLREASGGVAKERIDRVQVAGTPALRAGSVKPGDPDTWAAIVGDNTLFVAFNEASLAGALERARGASLAEASPEVEQARTALPEAAQGRLVFVAPEWLRTLVRSKIDEAAEDPGSAAMIGFMKPFRDLRSIGLGLEAAEDLRVSNSYDLGDPAVAGQAQAMFGGLLGPMAQAGLAQAAGRPPAEMADRIVFTTEGSALRLVYRMTAEDAKGFEEVRRKKAEEKAAAEAEGEEEAEESDPGH